MIFRTDFLQSQGRGGGHQNGGFGQKCRPGLLFFLEPILSKTRGRGTQRNVDLEKIPCSLPDVSIETCRKAFLRTAAPALENISFIFNSYAGAGDLGCCTVTTANARHGWRGNVTLRKEDEWNPRFKLY